MYKEVTFLVKIILEDVSINNATVCGALPMDWLPQLVFDPRQITVIAISTSRFSCACFAQPMKFLFLFSFFFLELCNYRYTHPIVFFNFFWTYAITVTHIPLFFLKFFLELCNYRYTHPIVFFNFFWTYAITVTHIPLFFFFFHFFFMGNRYLLWVFQQVTTSTRCL